MHVWQREERTIAHRRFGGVLMWLLMGIVALSVAGFAVIWGVNRSDATSALSQHEVYETSVSSFDLVIPTSGELEALNSIEIRNQVEARNTVITDIIAEGEMVKRGDVLVKISSDQIEERIREEELDVTSSEASVRSAEQALEIQQNENASAEQRARTAVEIAELELTRWQEGESKSRLTELNLSMEKAQRNNERLEREYEESEELFEQGFISLSEKEQDWIEVLESRANLENAERALDTYKNYTYPKELKQRESDLAEARAELERTLKRNESQLDQKQTDLKSKKKQLELRRDSLKRDQRQLEACTVIAPSDGLVVYGTSFDRGGWRGRENPLDIGQEVHHNELLIVLPDTSQLVASVKVHESQFNDIEEGMRARVRVDALNEIILDGEVLSVGVMAEQSWGTQVREYTVKILITEPNEWGLKPSMRCRADIFLGRVEESIAVPIQAVHVEKGKQFVWVRSGSKYAQREIEVGRRSESMIEVLNGISAGETVLLREPLPGEIA